MSGSRGYADRLDFQKRTTTTLASGQKTESWSTLFPRFGSVRQNGAAESNQNNQPNVSETYTVTVPLDSELMTVTSPAWRILWTRQDGTTVSILNITGIDKTARGRKAELKIQATQHT